MITPTNLGTTNEENTDENKRVRSNVTVSNMTFRIYNRKKKFRFRKTIARRPACTMTFDANISAQNHLSLHTSNSYSQALVKTLPIAKTMGKFCYFLQFFVMCNWFIILFYFISIDPLTQPSHCDGPCSENMKKLVAENYQDTTNLLMGKIQEQHLEKEAIDARKQILVKNIERVSNQQEGMKKQISEYQQKVVALVKENAVLQSALNTHTN